MNWSALGCLRTNPFQPCRCFCLSIRGAPTSSNDRDKFNPESHAALEATLRENPLRKSRLLKVIMLKMLNVPLEEASLGSLRLPIPRVLQHDPTHKIPHSQAELPHVTRLATWALQTCPWLRTTRLKGSPPATWTQKDVCPPEEDEDSGACGLSLRILNENLPPLCPKP